MPEMWQELWRDLGLAFFIGISGLLTPLRPIKAYSETESAPQSYRASQAPFPEAGDSPRALDFTVSEPRRGYVPCIAAIVVFDAFFAPSLYGMIVGGDDIMSESIIFAVLAAACVLGIIDTKNRRLRVTASQVIYNNRRGADSVYSANELRRSVNPEGIMVRTAEGKRVAKIESNMVNYNRLVWYATQKNAEGRNEERINDYV